MTAREMFEELGYKKDEYSKCICYYNPNEVNDEIVFYLENRTFNRDYYGHGNAIDMPVLKAINKQVEELGWLDE